MNYFKNIELATKYYVSESTVRHWVKSAVEGRLDLTLHTENGRQYVANNARNIAVIERLVEERKKYRTTKYRKTVTPQADFYRLYNQAQVYDIVRNLEVHHEVPREYNYFDGGADNWDQYAQRLATEDAPNVLTRTVQLLADNRGYLDKLLANYKRVNVVDIGPGNALPVKELLSHLFEQGKLGRYIAIDISAEMLRIAEHNIKEWFGGKVIFEGYEQDINYERFTNILAEDYLMGGHETVNLVLFLGGTPYNFRRPDRAFQTINDSMNRQDLFVYSDKLDSEKSRRYFDFNPGRDTSRLAPNHRFIFDLLNIDESFYDVEMGFDEQKHQRYIRVRLKFALAIKFEFETGDYMVDLDRGETILLWRAWQTSARDVERQHERTEFHILHASQSEDGEYVLTVARVKAE